MAPTPLFWILNKLKRRQFQERSTETLELKTDASTEKKVNQLFEESSEIGDTKMDVIKQEDQNHQCIVRSADTRCKTMDQKQVQNFLSKTRTKKLKHRLTCFWKREVKIEIKPKPSKPPVSLKNRAPKPSIPPTAEFLEYHRKKHAFLRKQIKFSPKLDAIFEVRENADEPKMCSLPTLDVLRPRSPTMHHKQVKCFLEKPKTKKLKHHLTCFWKRRVKSKIKPIPSKPPVPSKDRAPKPSIPPTAEFLEYHREKHAFLRKQIKFSPKLDSILEVRENADEPKMCRLPTLDELRPKSSPLGQHFMEQNRSKIFLKYGYWPDEDLYYMIEHEINPPDEPIVFKHQYTYEYVKWLEARKKQSEAPMFKSRFKRLKKFFKK
ncbi:hypothetical protein AVEN_155778-1 [Araneus ventricosus]|uniref:Uncharacterized protein n=1 Tax=Araneus ventricosus TaxID=182803 RepID=A0A4Y2BM24_ARAVE|nr:hypothetical protein AVEN_225570-1 [Araneus ventricosus]GBL93338.1 hypothetical protein AVEN_265865-1 [Araneus ventricosus]GBL93421.1 hypothetical protein AVEN_145443-1 [Araneus ventricosus]GBL93432.1 hypothetical protein AVEN_155778-1 [Araneus ventricosus]